jgi:hypothetical protein
MAKIKLEKFKEAGFKASIKVSDINRQLAFAGIAVCWIFKKDVVGLVQLPQELILPLTLFVITLALDIFQYIYQTVVWSIFWKSKENKPGVTLDSDFDAHPIWSSIAYIIFGLKVIVNLIGYFLIIKYLYFLLIVK